MSINLAILTESHKAAKAHNRMARLLNLALFAHLEQSGTDTQKERAQKALCNIGAKMLQAKNALPSEPSALRMYAESTKQKCEAILSKIVTDKTTLGTNATVQAVRKECLNALESITQFIAEYVEHKAATNKAA